MPIFERGDVVRVAFPYVDRNRRQHRPALVVSAGGIGPDGSLLWVVMITSAENEGWDSDVAIEDHVAAGLPVPSMVRPVKVATVQTGRAEAVGRLPRTVVDEVIVQMQAALRQPEH